MYILQVCMYVHLNILFVIMLTLPYFANVKLTDESL